MGRLVNILSEVVNSNTNRVINEAISKKVMDSLLNKFSTQSEDSEATMIKYINAFDRFKQSLPPKERDIQKYDYKDLKKVIDERVSKQKRKKEQDNILKDYMSNERLGQGMNIEDIKKLLKRYHEIKPYLPEKLQNVLSISGAQLSKLISDKFEDLFISNNFKKFKNDPNNESTDEEIMVRLERFVNGIDEVPKYTKPVYEMDFDEFEKVADVLPSVNPDENLGQIDLTDTEVVYEDDDVLIFLPDEKQKCINIRKKYAPDRGWCTSWEGSGNYYYNYRLNQNLTLYYVINKNLDLSDKDFASVILVEPYGGMRLADGTNRGRYAGGTTIPWNEISEKIPVIADKKDLFVAKPLTDEEQSDMKALRTTSVSRDAVEELGSEKRAALWIEVSNPNFLRMSNGEEIYNNLPDELKKKYIGLGNDLSPKMIQDSSPDVVRYLLNKKREALMNKTLDKLSDTDIALLNTPLMKELKEVLKSKYISQITGVNGDEITIDYPRDTASKYIALYGFEELFNNLPENLVRFDFINQSGGSLNLELPPSISKFKNLFALHIQDAVNELPKEISDLENLVILSLPNNPNLKSLPSQITDKVGDEYKLNNLQVVNLVGTPAGKNLSPEFQEMMKSLGISMF